MRAAYDPPGLMIVVDPTNPTKIDWYAKALSTPLLGGAVLPG
jgi:hypothetical protein